MSYSMELGDKHFNYTYNVGHMFYRVYPKNGIRTHYGMSGKASQGILRYLLTEMLEHSESMIATNPENGWGDYWGAIDFVLALYRAAIEFPDEIWEGD